MTLRDIKYNEQLRDITQHGSHVRMKTMFIDYDLDICAGEFPLTLATLKCYFKNQGVVCDYLIRYTMDDESMPSELPE
jgi:hypothetical protein